MTAEGVASFLWRIFSPPSISFRRHPQRGAKLFFEKETSLKNDFLFLENREFSEKMPNPSESLLL